jgi:Flp pilus assembly pilin Flp
MIGRFLSDRSGQNAFEYALIGSLMAVAILAALTIMGDATKQPFNELSTELAKVAP